MHHMSVDTLETLVNAGVEGHQPPLQNAFFVTISQIALLVKMPIDIRLAILL
jgi:hypothetical protein